MTQPTEETTCSDCGKLLDGTIDGLCEHVSQLLGTKVEYGYAKNDVTGDVQLSLVLHGIDFGMDRELYREEEEE